MSSKRFYCCVSVTIRNQCHEDSIRRG